MGEKDIHIFWLNVPSCRGDWIRTNDLLNAILGRACHFEEGLAREPERHTNFF
jgi:hypothetical protein